MDADKLRVLTYLAAEQHAASNSEHSLQTSIIALGRPVNEKAKGSLASENFLGRIKRGSDSGASWCSRGLGALLPPRFGLTREKLMKAKKLIDALAQKLKTGSQNELASALGISVQTLHNWKNQNKELSPLQVASALAKAQKSAIKAAQRKTVQPLAEFYALERCLTTKEKSWQIFPNGKDSTLYAQGLRRALEENIGIYIFYDSRGQGLYVGKAGKSLWKEMNLAFNRPREVQTIALVAHPNRNQEFKPGYEKLRQPKSTQLDLADLACYFSAYRVDAGMIDDIEALIVRGFANDLLNIRMETFAGTRNAKKAGPPR